MDDHQDCVASKIKTKRKFNAHTPTLVPTLPEFDPSGGGTKKQLSSSLSISLTFSAGLVSTTTSNS